MKTLHAFKVVLFTLFIAWAFSANAQTDNKITIGTIDSIPSKILNENRKIWVHVPAGGMTNLYTKQRYPVIYLLDGDGHFSSVVGMMQQLSSVNGNTVCPEMIVVGILNTDRMRDLSPTHVEADAYLTGDFLKKTGGGEAFISFIEKELMPYIESKYPTEPYKMLIGHSLGGLMVMQTLVYHPDLFNSYIAIDPSMWWDNNKLLMQSKKILADKKFDRKSLFLGIANTMDEGMSLEKVQKDTSNETRHIRSILELRSDLERNKQNGLKFQSKYYGDDTHSSAPLITEYDALHFIFDFYPFKPSTKERNDSTTLLATKYASHFTNLSKQFGYSVKPSENMVNGMGYQALANKQLQKAESFFKLNIANFPESGNVYDSYGDYFSEKKDTANAIAQFKKALSISENAETRQKLAELQGVGKAFKVSAADLQKYTGEFEMEGLNITIKTFVKDGKLHLLATGRPEAELYPTKQHEFTIKNVEGYSFSFDMEGDKPTALNLTVPEGSFKAGVKK
jgi:uncharacterized protein